MIRASARVNRTISRVEMLLRRAHGEPEAYLRAVARNVVNDALRVPRTERRRFRAILHNCRKHGVASQARGRPRFEDWLRGFAAYVKMVQPDLGARWVTEVEELLARDGGAS